jgi:hypothetical protein
MQHIDVKIGAVGDPPLFPELKSRIICEGKIHHCAILEAGMESGKCSMAFYVTLPDDHLVIVQMSTDMLLTIAGAAHGAVERFKK